MLGESSGLRNAGKTVYRHPAIDSVKEVHKDCVVYTQKDADGKFVDYEIPTNFVLWSTGIAKNSFSDRVCDLLPNQVHKKVSVYVAFQYSECSTDSGVRFRPSRWMLTCA